MNWFKLNDVCDVRDGTHDSPKSITNGYPLVTSKNIVNGEIDITNVNYISEEDFIKINKRSKVDDGDILMPMIGTIGKPIVVKKSFEFAIKNVALIKFNKDSKVLSKYVCYVLGSELFKKYVDKENRGGTQKFLSLSNIRDFKFPVPSIELQNNIIQVLDKAQLLINKRQSQIRALDELKQILFFEMFGDPIRNSKQLKLKQFKDVILLQRGFDLPVQSRDLTGNIKVYGSNGVLSMHSESKCSGGGIITGRSGSIGKVFKTEGEYWPLNTTLFSKETYGNNLTYLKYLLTNFKLERFVNGTGVPTLNRNIVHKENIIDVDIQLQNVFAMKVDSIEKEKLKLEESLKQMKTLYDSLFQKAFKGELFQD